MNKKKHIFYGIWFSRFASAGSEMYEGQCLEQEKEIVNWIEQQWNHSE